MSNARLIVCACIAATIVGCAREAAQPEATPPATAVSTSTLGKLELSLSRTEVTTVDRLDVHLSLTHAGGIGADDLQFSPQVAGWSLVSLETEGPEIAADGGVHTAWTYTLEPFLDGEYEIPPASIQLHDASTSTTLITPAQKVTVTSVLSEDVAKLAAARAPVKIGQASSGSSVMFALVGVGAALAFAGGGLAWWRLSKRRARRDNVQVSAPDSSPRGQVSRVRRELVKLLSTRVGRVPPNANIDEIASLARGRLDREQLDSLRQMLLDLDRLAYGPDEPRPEDIEGLRSDLQRLVAAEQEASV